MAKSQGVWKSDGYVGASIGEERRRRLGALAAARGRSVTSAVKHAVDLLLEEGFPEDTVVPKDLKPVGS